MSQDFRTWKRYRGGWAPDLWLFDLKTFAARNVTNDPANDAQPMWHGNTLYFMSDRGENERNNIWAYDIATGQVTAGDGVHGLRHHVSFASAPTRSCFRPAAALPAGSRGGESDAK